MSDLGNAHPSPLESVTPRGFRRVVLASTGRTGRRAQGAAMCTW